MRVWRFATEQTISRSSTLASSRGSYRKALALMPAIASDQRSLSFWPIRWRTARAGPMRSPFISQGFSWGIELETGPLLKSGGTSPPTLAKLGNGMGISDQQAR